MPLYEYHCDTCNTNFDRLMPVELRESCRCDCGSLSARVYTPIHIGGYGNKFMNDGPGFQSVTMSQEEYSIRARERSLPEALKDRGKTPVYYNKNTGDIAVGKQEGKHAY